MAGHSGAGKTYSVCNSFPNVVVADMDNGLSAFQGKDIISFPFYNSDWCQEQGAKKLKGNIDGLPIACTNRRDLFKKFVDEKFSQLDSSYTLFIDSWSKVQEFFDEATNCQPAMGSNGKVDTFSFWRRKITYSEQVMSALMSLKCSVVVAFHMYKETDEYGRETGKYFPLMQGKFKSKVQSYFDNFFVQHCITQTDAKGEDRREKKDKKGRLLFPQTELLSEELNYLWQVRNSVDVDSKCALPGVEGPFVPATYKSIEKAFS